MKLEGFLREQIISRLKYDNPWWISGEIVSDYMQMKRRPYINLFYPLINDKSIRRTVVLMGPRRVGKTVMIFHSIEKLLQDGVDSQKIIYLSLDTPIYNNLSLEFLFELAREALSQKDIATDFFVFYDEIQYLVNWELHLKSMSDSYRSVKFVASGSAAAALKQKSNESGAGRFTDFMLPPLTFSEYLHLKNLDRLIVPRQIKWKGQNISAFDTINIAELNTNFLDYINYGGYPEVVFSDKIRSDPGQYIRHDIIDKVLLRDLPGLYGINDTQELNRLFIYIAYRSGSEFSYENLSKESGIRTDVLKKYLEYLSAAFLIKVVFKTDINAKRMQRITSFKIYLTNPSLRCALFSPLSLLDESIGNMVETAIFAQWIQRDNTQVFYANWSKGREKGEVDLVGLDLIKQKPGWAVEIKWSDRYFEHYKELKSLLQFMEINSIEEAIVTTISKFEEKQLQKIRLQYIPSAVYAYIVGHNTFEKKQQTLGL
jgi:hypothetical protein